MDLKDQIRQQLQENKKVKVLEIHSKKLWYLRVLKN